MSTLAARRKQRYRARQRAGQAVLTIEICSYELTLALIEAGFVTEAEALDRGKIERAVAAVLDRWTRHWLTQK